MPRHRHEFPAFSRRPVLTDGGIETTLIFEYGLELPAFAAFTLLDSAEGLADGTLLEQFPDLTVVGGCCGTDQRHVEQACLAVRGRS